MHFLPLDWTDLSPGLPITLGRELGAQKFDLELEDNSAEKMLVFQIPRSKFNL